MAQAPFIITLRLSKESFLLLEDARTRYFPAHLNMVPAHVSLFHHLPGAEQTRISDVLKSAADETRAFRLQVAGLRNLGFGVAYELQSLTLMRLRERLANEFDLPLTNQDRQKYKPHVTIQNKVPASQARETLAELKASFQPFDLLAKGFCLWRYLNGPWELVDSYRFPG